MNIADLRGIEPENACAACDATGYKYYPTTATWHGGAGGMAITRGICDRCWGSGDRTYTWCNLRDIANRIDEKDRIIARDTKVIQENQRELSRCYARIDALQLELYGIENGRIV